MMSGVRNVGARTGGVAAARNDMTRPATFYTEMASGQKSSPQKGRNRVDAVEPACFAF